MSTAYDAWQSLTGEERLAVWDLYHGRNTRFEDILLYRQAHPHLTLGQAIAEVKAQPVPEKKWEDG